MVDYCTMWKICSRHGPLHVGVYKTRNDLLSYDGAVPTSIFSIRV